MNNMDNNVSILEIIEYIVSMISGKIAPDKKNLMDFINKITLQVYNSLDIEKSIIIGNKIYKIINQIPETSFKNYAKKTAIMTDIQNVISELTMREYREEDF